MSGRLAPLGAVLLLSVFLQSCSSQYVAYSESTGPSAADRYQETRYSMKQDRAPDEVLDGHVIKDVVPRTEPLSRYGNKSPYKVRGKTYQVMKDAASYSATGVASWYGAKFHGHRTSSGELFDMYQVSAAHKTLPLPTFVRVTNLDNGRSVIARVNDRGPFHGGRLIDLSYAGAVKLGYEKQGTARVKVEVVGLEKTQKSSGAGEFVLQVGAFSTLQAASQRRTAVAGLTEERVFIEKTDLYRVKVGPLNEKQARRVEAQISGSGLGAPIMIKQ